MSYYMALVQALKDGNKTSRPDSSQYSLTGTLRYMAEGYFRLRKARVI